eukprot:2375637-Ditylum_brightwellii.AAC.1
MGLIMLYAFWRKCLGKRRERWSKFEMYIATAKKPNMLLRKFFSDRYIIGRDEHCTLVRVMEGVAARLDNDAK